MSSKKSSKKMASRKGPWSLGKGTRVHKHAKSYKREKGTNLMKNLDENKFRRFFNLVLEQDAPPATEDPALNATPEDDAAALEQGLEADTAPEDFDVEPKTVESQTGPVKKIMEFITKMEEFKSFLNDEQGDSVNKFINEIDKEGSILQGISSESNKVTTVAENVASLIEAFNGAVLKGLRKEREKQAAMDEF